MRYKFGERIMLRILSVTVVCFAGVLCANSQAVSSAAQFTVTANPLWTDTGIQLNASDIVTIWGATGSWTPADGVPSYTCGPGGWVGNNTGDAWFINSENLHAQLIGYIGNTKPTYSFPQNAPGMFDIGIGTVTLGPGLSGELWLGFNDDWASRLVSDNAGSVVVNVSTVPEPSTFALLGMGVIGLIGWTWKRR